MQHQGTAGFYSDVALHYDMLMANARAQLGDISPERWQFGLNRYPITFKAVSILLERKVKPIIKVYKELPWAQPLKFCREVVLLSHITALRPFSGMRVESASSLFPR